MAKITSLTAEQEAAIPKYYKEAVEVGLATGSELDLEKVRDLTDKHRILCGVPAAKEFKVFDSPMEAIKNIDGINTSNALYGQHDAHWLYTYLFYRNECGLIEETEKIVHLVELAKLSGWMWMNEENTIVTRRPDEVHMKSKSQVNVHGDPIKVLHNEMGPAIKYRNGDAIYALNGIVVPKWLIEEPYDAEKVLGIKNTEVRNEGLKHGGPNVLEKYLSPVTLDTDSIDPGGNYKLYTIDIGNNTRTYLKGYCPSSNKEFNEAVPPEFTKVRDALQWREWGRMEIPSNEYIVPMVRT